MLVKNIPPSTSPLIFTQSKARFKQLKEQFKREISIILQREGIPYKGERLIFHVLITNTKKGSTEVIRKGI